MRYITSIILLCSALSLSAQPMRKGEAIQAMQCEQMIEILQLSAAKSDAFREIYLDYYDETRRQRLHKAKPRLATEPSEEMIEQMTLRSFDESIKSIELKREYYAKFRTILKPSEIANMYRTERTIRDKAVGELYRRGRK